MRLITVARAACAAFVGVSIWGVVSAGAAEYPARPIRYVVAFAPGGINDILARVVGDKLAGAWGQTVIVDNRPGAGGNVGAEIVARAPADGHTILNISTAHAISQTLYPKLSYDLLKDLAPVVLLGGSPLIMAIHPSIPAKNVAEFVTWGKTNHIRYASGGVGVISHLSMEMFKQAAKIPGTHVPYKGAGPGMVDLMAGQVQVMVNAIPELYPFAKSGKLRVLGIMADKRHAFMPDVPTFPEQGYKEFIMSNWVGIVAPTGTPKAVIDRLAAQVTKSIKEPDVTDKLAAQGFDPFGGSPEEFGKLVRSETARFGKAVRESGAKAE
jgi:tripartite-type tricarboxylate transporter receptor subunit TctC